MRLGLVASLNRPGGNVTGVNGFLGDLLPKQLRLLHELVPKASLLGAPVFPSGPSTEAAIANIHNAARAIRGAGHRPDRHTTDAQIEAARFPTVCCPCGAGAVLVNASSLLRRAPGQARCCSTARYALPTMYSRREMASMPAGLISYGPDSADDGYRTMGVYTGLILEARSRPICQIVQPTKFELVVNRKDRQRARARHPAGRARHR